MWNKINKIEQEIDAAADLAKVIHDLIDYSVEWGSDDCSHFLQIAEMLLESALQLRKNFEEFQIELYNSKSQVQEQK